MHDSVHYILFPLKLTSGGGAGSFLLVLFSYNLVLDNFNSLCTHISTLKAGSTEVLKLLIHLMTEQFHAMQRIQLPEYSFAKT